MELKINPADFEFELVLYDSEQYLIQKQTKKIYLYRQKFKMSLIPNKKNKKDNRPGGGGSTGTSKPNQQNSKVKLNTKGLSRNTKQTGGSQRGS